MLCTSTGYTQSTWNGGGGDDNWTTGANWGGTAPVAGAALAFGGTARLVPINNFAVDTLFNGITFNAGSDGFNLTGNRIKLGNNIVNNDDSLQTVSLDLALTGTRTITGGTGGISLNGVISQSGGTFGLTTGGNVTLAASNTYAGTTTINSGTLALSGAGALADGSAVNVAVSGAVFDISAITGSNETIGSLAAVSGASVVLGNKTLTAGGTNANTTFTGTMTGTGGGFTKTGTGTMVISGAFTQTGLTTASAGILELKAGSITGGSINVGATGIISLPQTGVANSSTLGGSITNTTGGQIFVGNTSTLTIQGGSSITNNGTISTNASGISSSVLRITGDVSVTGTGVITMTNNDGNSIRGNTGTERLTNGVGHTIQGAGTLGGDIMAFTNDGTILANVSSFLIIDPSATGAINSGTGIMRASGGGTMTFKNGTLTNTGLVDASGGTINLSTATVTNTGGTIQTTGTSTITLTSTTISGGSINNSATGVISLPQTGVANNSTIGASVTNAAGGQIFIGNTSSLTLQSGGTITNNGNISANATGIGSSSLKISGDVAINGSGTITLGNNDGNTLRGVVGTERFTNGAGHTVQGAGTFGADLLAITNDGTILANTSSFLFIDPNAAGAINGSTGVMRAASGSTMTFKNGTLDNSGLMASAGTLNITTATVNNAGGTLQTEGTGLIALSGSTVTGGTTQNTAGGTISLAASSITGGTINNSATGIIGVPQSNTGTLGGSVTNSAGGQIVANNGSTLTLQGGGSYTNNGTISVNSGGLDATLKINGDVTLGGTGSVTLSNVNASTTRFYGTAGTERLTNSAGHTIQGSGLLGNNLMALTNDGLITTTGTSGLTIDPNASGAGNSATGVIRAAGTSALSFQNGSLTNTGVVETTGGTLSLVTASITNTGGTIRGSAGTLNVTSSTVTGGSVELSGTGALNLSNSTITGGSFSNSGSGSLAATTGTSNISSPMSLTASNSISATSGRVLNISGGITKDANTTTFQGGGTINVSSVGISGASATSNVVVSDSGTSVTLSAPNTYGGSTTLSGGTLTISGAGTIPDTSAVNFTTASTLSLSGITAGSETIGSLAGTAGSVVLGGKNLTTGGTDATTSFAGVISGTLGSLTKIGSGTMTLSGNNTYTGVTTLGSGAVSVASIGNGGVAGGMGQASNAAANWVFDGGALQYTGANASTNRSFTINTGKTAIFDITTNNLTLTGTSAATNGGLTKIGAGTLTLSAANAHTGMTTVNAGTLAYGISNALSTGGITVDGATAVLSLGSFNDTVGSVVVLNGGSITSTGGILTTTSDLDLRSGSSDAPMAGSVGLNKTTAGTATLTKGNSYTGLTTVTQGTLEVTANSALGTNAAGTTVGNGGTLRLNGVNYTTAEALTINGTGAGGAGALRNSGTSSYAGQVTAATDATIHAGGGNLTFTGGLVKNGTTLTLTGGGTITVSTTGISGASANSDLVMDGTTANLNVANTYNGPTFIRNGGTINANTTGALPASPRSAVTMDDSGSGSSTLALGASQSIASLTGAASSSVNVGSSTLTVGAASGGTAFAGGITGTGAVVKDGNSTQTLSGASTYSGGTSVTAGTLNVTNTSGSATGSGALTIGSSGTLAGTGRVTAAADNLITINGALVVGDSTLGSPVASELTLATSGSGSTVLGVGAVLRVDLFSGAGSGDNTGSSSAADRIRLFGSLDPTLGGTLVIGNPNGISGFAYGDQWQLFDLTSGSISGALALDFSSLTITGGRTAEFDYDTGILSITPEPSRALMLLAGCGTLLVRRKRRIS